MLTGWDLVSFSFLFDFDYDVRNILDSSSLRPDGNNIFNYENSDWDDLVDDYSSLTVLSDRKEKANELNLFLSDNEPIIPIFTLQDNYLVDNSVSGYDEILLSIGDLDWEKLIIDSPEVETEDEASLAIFSFLFGIILIPVIRKKRKIGGN